jgi:hypothetical protein
MTAEKMADYKSEWQKRGEKNKRVEEICCVVPDLVSGNFQIG